MADQDPEDIPTEDLPTDFLLRKTRSRVPWTFVLVVCVLAGAAGAVLWYLMSGG